MKLTLKNLREKRGWSLKISEKIYGIPLKTIKAYEEYRKVPRIEDLTVMLKMLGANYDEIVSIIYEDFSNRPGVVCENYIKINNEEKNMKENNIIKNGNLTTLMLENNVVFIEDDTNNITICSANNNKFNITISKNDILKISVIRNCIIDKIRNRKRDYTNYNEIKVGNVIIDIGSEWLIFMCRDTILTMNADMFETMINYINHNGKGDK